ncbi:MAG: hypothetical protein ACJAT4_000921 [Granulosicoccus sp.]|jgi:uncharacterized protein (DUF1499 family)
MKYLFSIIILLSMGWTTDSSFIFSEKTKLDPCPNSPNCVSTQETRKRKRMRPILFTESSDLAIEKLERMLASKSRVTLVEKKGNYLHYEFKTKIGKFIDDVEFLFDEETKQIHFRSASRKGYGDFGKNKRRMKKIRKEYEK